MDLRSFLTLTGTTRPRRATERAIGNAEKRIGQPLPGSLRSFYEQTDGVDLTALGGLHLLSLDALIEHHGGLKVWGIPDEWRYIPFAWCEGTSDRLCVSTHPALDGRVVFVPHDDGPSVAFPDLEHLLDAIASAHRKHCGGGSLERLARAAQRLLSDDEDDGEFLDLHELSFWYREHQERSAADADAAAQLLGSYLPRLREDDGDVVAEQGVHFSCTLLPPDATATLVELLDVVDPSGGRILGRLRAISSDASRHAIAEYHRTLASLGARLEAAARAAGHEASVWPPDEDGAVSSLVVGRGSQAHHFSIDHWYARRGDPDLEQAFADRLAARVRR